MKMLNTTIKYCLAVTMAAAGAAVPATALAQTTAKQAYAQAVPAESLKKVSAVDRLLAIEEIKQLSLRYSRCITQKDWECVRGLFTADFVMGGRATGPEGFIDVMRNAGTYDRVSTVLRAHGAEIEMLSPTTARGIVGADFTFYHPPGQRFAVTGKEVVAPGQETHTDTYYYHTYEKVSGVWKIKTLDHVSFDLRTDFTGYTRIFERAYVTPEGVPPYKR